jgi:CheY-like chemotaxis protein
MPDIKKKILVVDDSALNRRLLEDTLVQKGFLVTMAEDGQQGLMLMTQEMPDLILMDVVMPNMGGWEATRHMRKVAKTQLVPIILMTTKNTPHDMLASFEAGADDFINKPIDMPELFEMIDKLLEKVAATKVEKANPAK